MIQLPFKCLGCNIINITLKRWTTAKKCAYTICTAMAANFAWMDLDTHLFIYLFFMITSTQLHLTKGGGGGINDCLDLMYFLFAISHKILYDREVKYCSRNFLDI